MDNELLYAEIEALEGKRPLAYPGARKVAFAGVVTAFVLPLSSSMP
jgi:hypothetical protein